MSGLRSPAPLGFTLVELVVALALAAVIATLAGRSLIVSKAAREAVTRTSDRDLACDLATEELDAVLARAGARHYESPDVLTPPMPDRDLSIELSAGVHGDALRVRYLDTDVQDGPVLRDLRFFADTDARGDDQLYRQAGDANKQPLVEGVHALHLRAWVDASGLHPRRDLALGGLRPWLLLLDVQGADGGVYPVAVPLPYRPSAQVLTRP